MRHSFADRLQRAEHARLYFTRLLPGIADWDLWRLVSMATRYWARPEGYA